MNLIKKVVSILILLLVIPIVFSISQEALNTKNELFKTKLIIAEMEKSGFTILRVNDTYQKAKQEYDAQVALEEKSRKGNYEGILAELQEIKDIREKALYVGDELSALKIFLDDKNVSNFNISEAISLYEEAKQNFKDERYEIAEGLVQDTYDKVAELEATSARINAVYEATSRSIKNFIIKNWIILTAIFIILTTSLILFYNKFKLFNINRKISRLEFEKDVIKNLIKKTQLEYFQKGKMSEANYTIKIKRFGELIRDINRQIPLLKEELVKLQKKKKNKSR